MKRLRSLLLALVAMIVVATPVIYIIAHQQQIVDWISLRNYVPPVAVATLANETTMNDTGRRIFYVARPQIQDKTSFYSSCNENEQTIVLGCFVEGRGIYILSVSDERLRGVEQVTAAHEMLHAAYERLDNQTKTRIIGLLQADYAKLNDSEISKKIDQYKKANADINNELHSIMGTEVANLSPELEAYYRQYFISRAKIAGYAQQYKSVFMSRKQKLDDYNQQLSSIEKQVVTNNEMLASQSGALDQEEARLTELRAANNIDAYNAGVGPYNAKLANYNALVDKTRSLVAQYKDILTERNKIAEEAQELSKALDSRISTPSTK